MSLFADRRDAGRVLASILGKYMDRADIVVVALPRGGVPVAHEVALQLGAPLDVLVVRKLGVPGHEELAMGALAAGGLCVLNDEVVRAFGIKKEDIFEVARAENHELARRDHAYRGDGTPEQVAGKVVILIDDGLATGSTLRVAIQALRQRGPSHIVAAVPVAARETCSEVSDEADELICAVTPEPFQSVGSWYQDFAQTTDDEVCELLDATRREQRRRSQDALATAGSRP